MALMNRFVTTVASGEHLGVDVVPILMWLIGLIKDVKD